MFFITVENEKSDNSNKDAAADYDTFDADDNDEDHDDDVAGKQNDCNMMLYTYLKKVVCRLGDPTVESDWGLVEVSLNWNLL